jgi:hypothetical protein
LEWTQEPAAPSATREIRTQYAAATTSQFCGEEIKITSLAREAGNADHGHAGTDRPPVGKGDAMRRSDRHPDDKILAVGLRRLCATGEASEVSQRRTITYDPGAASSTGN